MTISDFLTAFGRNPMGGYDAQSALAVGEMTMIQIGLVLRDPKKLQDEPATDNMTERDYHRLRFILNGWPEWLEEKEWKSRSDP